MKTRTGARSGTSGTGTSCIIHVQTKPRPLPNTNIRDPCKEQDTRLSSDGREQSEFAHGLLLPKCNSVSAQEEVKAPISHHYCKHRAPSGVFQDRTMPQNAAGSEHTVN